MTTVVVNAISIREGGALVVLRELLAGMSAQRPHWQWYVVVNSQAPALPEMQNVEYLCFPLVDGNGYLTRIWYETGLRNLVKRLGADVLFSTTNYLPLRRMPCRSLLLVQNAGHFSPLFRRLTEEKLGLLGRCEWRMKGRWVKASVRLANAVTVQTETLAEQIARKTDVAADKLCVVPHGTGQARPRSAALAAPAAGDNFRVGYITMYGVQKNFAVLFEAMARLKRTGLPVSLSLTLSEAVPMNRQVLALAHRYGLTGIIENHGDLPPAELSRLYESLHAFVFPSLCESFGFPMVEAMAYGLPLLVAATDSNIEVAGEAGISFPPSDAEVLAHKIERLALDPEWFQQRAQASLNRSIEFQWDKAANSTVALMEGLMPSARGRNQDQVSTDGTMIP